MMHLRPVSALVVTSVLGHLLPAATGGPQATSARNAEAVIVGTIRDAVTGEPVFGAVVSISGAGGSAQVAVPVEVDAVGRYAFDRLVSGQYTLVAERPGYIRGSFGRLRPRGTAVPLALGSGERVLDADIRLWPAARLRGSVGLGSDALPAARSIVELYEAVVAGDQEHWTQRQTTVTDDSGQYEFHSLEPGTYEVVVPSRTHALPVRLADAEQAARVGGSDALRAIQDSNRAGGVRGLPGATVDGVFSTKSLVLVQTPRGPQSGEESLQSGWLAARSASISVETGAVLTVPPLLLANVRLHTVTGRIVRPPGYTGPLAVRAFRSTEGRYRVDTHTEVASSTATGDGQFELAGLPSGDYELWAAQSPARETGLLPLWGATQVVVADTHVVGIELHLTPPAQISGSVVLADAGQPPAEATKGLRVSLEDSENRVRGPAHLTLVRQDTVKPHGGFGPLTVLPGVYHLTVEGMDPPWRIAHIRIGARRAPPESLTIKEDTEITVVLEPDGGRLTGAVHGIAPRTRSVTAVVFPVDRRSWTRLGGRGDRFRTQRLDVSGRFDFVNLAPGDYYVTALEEVSLDRWDSPKRLERLVVGAAAVTIRSQGTMVQDLKVQR